MALGPRQLGLAPEEVNRRVEEALARVHLLDRAGDDPFSLTKGQRQCLAVAGVLALAPRVIILDEPTTGLDFREQQDLLDLVPSCTPRARTIIMVTHSMWAAATYAQRLVVLKDGQVLLDGPTREVLAQEEILSQARLGARWWSAQPAIGFSGADPGGVSGSLRRPCLIPGWHGQAGPLFYSYR